MESRDFTGGLRPIREPVNSGNFDWSKGVMVSSKVTGSGKRKA